MQFKHPRTGNHQIEVSLQPNRSPARGFVPVEKYFAMMTDFIDSITDYPVTFVAKLYTCR